jgi:uncharacterized protein (UPF0218 family)
MNTRNEKNENDHQLMATSITKMDEEYLLLNNHKQSLANIDFEPDLIAKLAGDVIVACGVTLGIAPFMSVIDKSVVQRAAGTHTIVQSCVESVSAMVRNPSNFVRSPMFVMMWGVYAATYTTGEG